jgi:uncharacterized membrane protein
MEIMTRKTDKDALDQLTDNLVDDILNTSDDEILAELKEHDIDAEQLAASMRTLFDKTMIAANKHRLAAAKAGVAALKKASETVKMPSLDIAAARERLNRILETLTPDQNLTLAARKAIELSDADVLSLLDDLNELGLAPPEDREQ